MNEDEELRRVTKKASILEQDNFKLMAKIEEQDKLIKLLSKMMKQDQELGLYELNQMKNEKD